MAIIVQKFGGSSVKDADHLRNVAGIITEAYDKGNSIVVVVSAQGDTTDDLIEKAAELNERPSKREMDVLLSAGEQISMALLAMTIEKMGYPVISLTGWQAGVKTTSKHGSAGIKNIDTERILEELDKHKIVIVAGFQGISKYDNITTLGRGGSDTSAVAIAAALKAELCQIYTDVDGVYTADPRIVKNAHKLDEISFDEMLELATLGAQVLQNRSVEIAKKYNVNLEVVSSLTKAKGTKVVEVTKMEKMLIKGVTKDTSIARISVVGVADVPGIAFRIFDLLGRKDINVDIILQSIGREGTKDMTFTVSAADADYAAEALHESELLKDKKILVDKDVAKVSIVGAGMETHAGVASRMFEALYDAGINIQMISTSEIKISVLIAKNDADRAVIAIHDKFEL
ncbi:MAG: aspartate kinase [Clostridia bacterium]|nr:aspartate kinase [Clostridia bacterium]